MIKRSRPTTKIVLVKDGKQPVYELSGDIDPFADWVFEDVVGNRVGGTLRLKSLGGDVATSIAIGKLARTHKIKTYVPRNTYCLSGCAIIWAGGYERHVAKGATLGFHRPWRRVDGQVVEGSTVELEAYFKELGFSDAVIERFLWPADRFYYLDGPSAEILGVKATFQN